MARAKSAPASAQSSANIGFETRLWIAADKLRNNMDAAGSELSDKRRQQPELNKPIGYAYFTWERLLIHSPSCLLT